MNTIFNGEYNNKGLYTRVVSFNDLPKEVKEKYGDDENDNFLLVYYDGKLISSESDFMEPEDTTFCRDLKWIEPLLHKVYTLGVQEKAP